MSSDDDPCVLPLPDDALPLADQAPANATARTLAVLALREQMASLGLALPLGPALALDDPERLLLLNGFRVQLVCAPCGADRLSAASAPWQRAEQAPHFLLAACVEEDLQVVWMPGVLTNNEVMDQGAATGGAATIALEMERFQGGVDRLLNLVRLLDPRAMPLRGLQPQPTAPRDLPPLPVAHWLRGWIDDSLLALGAQLLPVGGAGFRAAAPVDVAPSTRAILAIPLGVVDDVLCWGEARAGAIERFQLQLIARGDGIQAAHSLRVRLRPHLAGDVLPDGLRLVAGPRAAVSAISQGLELEVSGSDTPIQIAVEWGGSQLRLPPLLLHPSEPPEAFSDIDADR
jgi:hypothetical protein